MNLTTFGKTQFLSSERMKRSPLLSKFVHFVFGYTNVGNFARSRVFIRLIKKLPLREFRRVMDLGAGLGEYTFMMADGMPQTNFVALEIIPERIRKLQEVVDKFKYNNVEVYPDYIETIPEDNQYDFIFSVDVFEHIPKDKMPFKECYRKLKPGGYLMVKIPNVRQRTILPDRLFNEFNHWLEVEHVGQVYDLDGLKQRFEEEGFTVVHGSSSDGLLARFGWELEYLSRKGGSLVQLVFLPLCKALVRLDGLFFDPESDGNAIQVIGRK